MLRLPRRANPSTGADRTEDAAATSARAKNVLDATILDDA